MYIKSLADVARTPQHLSCDLLVPIFSVDHKLLNTGESLFRDVRILAHKVVHDVHLRTQEKKPQVSAFVPVKQVN
jgi:hypothetical protein